jgi:hypothetical protein
MCFRVLEDVMMFLPYFARSSFCCLGCNIDYMYSLAGGALTLDGPAHG